MQRFRGGSYLRLIDFVYHSNLGLKVIKKKKRVVLPTATPVKNGSNESAVKSGSSRIAPPPPSRYKGGFVGNFRQKLG